MKNQLTDKEVLVLALRDGNIVDSPLTLEEVGKRMGVTRERVRQIEAKAREKMRSYARQNSVDFLVREISEKKMLRIERWRDDYKHYRVGIEWYGEDDYEFICEKPTLLDALQLAYDYLNDEK